MCICILVYVNTQTNTCIFISEKGCEIGWFEYHDEKRDLGALMKPGLFGNDSCYDGVRRLSVKTPHHSLFQCWQRNCTSIYP